MSIPFNCSFGTRFWKLVRKSNVIPPNRRKQKKRYVMWCISNAPSIDRCRQYRLCSFNLPYYCFLLFIYCMQHTPYECQWKRWRNCCLGNNNHHFGIIVTHVGNCVSVCVCNEVVLVNTKCAPEKRSVAIVNVVRLTTIWRLIKGIRLHIWREWQTQGIGCFVRFFGANFGGRKVLLVRSKISQNEFYSFFLVVVVAVEFTVSEDLIKIIGADWKEFSDVDDDECSNPLHRVILFRWFLFASFSQSEHPIWPCEMNECFGTWIVQIN